MPGETRTSAAPVVSDHNLLAAIVERVDTGAVATEMVATFREEIAGYQRLPQAVLMGQIYEVSRQNVDLFFRSITDGRGPTPEELEAFRASARNRASEGMPLEDLLHAYRLGGRLGWRAITAAARTTEEQRALLLGAELLMRYVDQISAVVAQTYLDERQVLVSEEERRLRDLTGALLRDAPLSSEAEAFARRAGFPVTDRYRPFALVVPGAPAHVHSQVAAALRARGVLALTEGDRVAGLAPEDTDRAAMLDGRSLVAFGDPTRRAELPAALEEMRLLVELGRREGRTGAIAAEACLLELLLARSPRLAGLVRRRALGPLEAYAERRASDLLPTLQTFVACDLDRRRAAEELHVHPNTLDYRLQRVAELTGLDLGRPADLALVTLALRQRELTDGDL